MNGFDPIMSEHEAARWLRLRVALLKRLRCRRKRMERLARVTRRELLGPPFLRFVRGGYRVRDVLAAMLLLDRIRRKTPPMDVGGAGEQREDTTHPTQQKQDAQPTGEAGCAKTIA